MSLFKCSVVVFLSSNCNCEARLARSLAAETGRSPAKEAGTAGGTSQVNLAWQEWVPPSPWKGSFKYKNIHRWLHIAGSLLLGELTWDLIVIRICWVMNIRICKQSKHVQDLCVLCNEVCAGVRHIYRSNQIFLTTQRREQRGGQDGKGDTNMDQSTSTVSFPCQVMQQDRRSQFQQTNPSSIFEEP